MLRLLCSPVNRKSTVKNEKFNHCTCVHQTVELVYIHSDVDIDVVVILVEFIVLLPLSSVSSLGSFNSLIRVLSCSFAFFRVLSCREG